MGLIKCYLEQKISEFANKIRIDKEVIYQDDLLYDTAVRYAQLRLMVEGSETDN